MAFNRIRTVLIEDSAFMRKLICDIIKSDDTIDLVGVARNGHEGSEMTVKLKPDVVITDMVMPEYDGLYVVNEVMKRQPVPIILLSSLEKSDARIFDALNYGAFEFIDKPTDVNGRYIHDYRLLQLIKVASRTDISLLKAKQLAKNNDNHHSFSEKLNYEIIVMGSSTGGPGAVEYIVNNFPSNLQIPVVVVQHMPPRFLETFATRLNDNSPIPVQLARRGESLKGGIIYVAPGDANMRIENALHGGAMFTFTAQKYPEFNYPSVDCLFESAAEYYGKNTIGVILTGMGKDGAAGLGKIKNSGGFTIGQDEESSVVYGMPKVAFDTGAVKQVVPLREIPGFVISCL